MYSKNSCKSTVVVRVGTRTQIWKTLFQILYFQTIRPQNRIEPTRKTLKYHPQISETLVQIWCNSDPQEVRNSPLNFLTIEGEYFFSPNPMRKVKLNLYCSQCAVQTGKLQQLSFGWIAVDSWLKRGDKRDA